MLVRIAKGLHNLEFKLANETKLVRILNSQTTGQQKNSLFFRTKTRALILG